jgi:hypothetical protein
MRYLFLIALLAGGLAGRAQFSIENSELFVEVKEPGKYEISVNQDYAFSHLGRTRFYNLSPGLTKVVVSLAGKPVLRKDLSLRPGQRTIAAYSKHEGLRIMEELSIYKNFRYALDSWNGTLYEENNRPETGRPAVMRRISAGDFDNLFTGIKKELFDDGKQKVLTLALQSYSVSTSQLSRLLELFSFDDQRLNAALNSYSSIYDQERFFQLRGLFTSFNKNKFDDFLLKQGR